MYTKFHFSEHSPLLEDEFTNLYKFQIGQDRSSLGLTLLYVHANMYDYLFCMGVKLGP